MVRHVIQRLILLVGTLIGVLTVTFVLTHILPGSPVEVMLGHRPTPDQIEAAKHQLGLELGVRQGGVVQARAEHFNQSLLNPGADLGDQGHDLRQADAVFSLTLLGPAVIAATITFGLMQQIMGAFGQVSSSFQYLVNSWSTIVELQSIYKRLRGFESAIHGEAPAPIEAEPLTA